MLQTIDIELQSYCQDNLSAVRLLRLTYAIVAFQELVLSYLHCAALKFKYKARNRNMDT